MIASNIATNLLAFIIVLVYLLGMALIWLAPETKGRPLPP